MSRYVALTVVVIGLGVAFAHPDAAFASEGRSGATDASTEPSMGTVTVAASFEFDGGQQVSGSAPSKPQCAWTAYGAPGAALPGEAEPAWAAQASAMDATL